MTGTATADTMEFRAHVHGMWATVAEAWGERAEYIDARGAVVTERMLERAALRPGERVLELASGPGGVALAAAPRVAPGGEVVVSDVVAEMTAIAAARAAALGLDNVTARVLDLEAVDEPDGAFDVVLCREGLMFATDPARAAAELRRVLGPGGRAVVAVWGPRERNPWLSLVFDAVTAELGVPVPPPGVPGPFSLDDADGLAALLTGAGLVDVRVDEVAVPLRVGSFDEWWAHMSALAGPLATMLASLPAPKTNALEARLRTRIGDYESTGGYEIPGVSLVASARREPTA